MSKQQIDIANALFRTLLSTIIQPAAQYRSTILNIWNEYIISGNLSYEPFFEENFHEYSYDPETKHPTLYGHTTEDSWWFCKTARKRYDLAVYATIKAVYDGLWLEFASDWDVSAPNYLSLENYVEQELRWWKFKYSYELMENFCTDAVKKLKDSLIPDIRFWELTIEAPCCVDDLRYIANEIDGWVRESPKDGMYKWQPAWKFIS